MFDASVNISKQFVRETKKILVTLVQLTWFGELVEAVDAVVGPSWAGGRLEEDQLEGEDLPTAAAVDVAGAAGVVGDVEEPSEPGWAVVEQWVEDLEVAVVG